MSEIKSQLCFLTPRRVQPHLPLFVFLPGMDGTGQLLRAQTEGLEAVFDVRCLAIPPDDLNSWAVLTEKVAALIEAELTQTPGTAGDRLVYLCGESFGGCLAMKLVLHAPALFDRLILVNPASSFGDRPWIGWGAQLTRWLPEPLYRSSAVILLPLLAHLGRITAADRAALLNTVQSVPQKTSVWRMALLSQFTVLPVQLRQIRQPVLLVAGATDRLLPSLPEVRRLASTLPNAKVVVLPHSGHACLLERGVNLYEVMQAEEFLDQSVVKSPPSFEGN
jgi:pimeloyl-ACP methyl ester carboxylesterase